MYRRSQIMPRIRSRVNPLKKSRLFPPIKSQKKNPKKEKIKFLSSEINYFCKILQKCGYCIGLTKFERIIFLRKFLDDVNAEEKICKCK